MRLLQPNGNFTLRTLRLPFRMSIDSPRTMESFSVTDGSCNQALEIHQLSQTCNRSARPERPSCRPCRHPANYQFWKFAFYRSHLSGAHWNSTTSSFLSSLLT